MAKTVLLLEADSSHADALKIYLGRKQAEVHVAATDEKARGLLASRDFDILLGNPYGFGEACPGEVKRHKLANPLLQVIIFCPRALMDQAMDDFGPLAANYLDLPLNSKALGLALDHAEKCIATEKKLAAYSQRLSDLHDAQSLYQQLFNEVPCYITVQNKDLRITDTNAKFKRDFGHEVGGFCYEIYKHRSSPCPECPVAKTFYDGGSHGTEEVVTSKAGKQYNVITQTAPIKDENGQITQVMEMSTNITQIRQLQDHLSSLGLMLGSMSHGIKGMLTALDGSIYQLETGLQKEDRTRMAAACEQIKEMTERIKKMVLDILYYAKSRELQYALTDVRELAETVVSMISPQARHKGINLVTELEKDLGIIEMDPNWMQAALINFLDNAVDACLFDPKEKEHRVVFRVSPRDPETVCFVIEDNGTGMDRQTRETLFTLFFSSKGSQGTGLGLFIANHVVQQHGGSITIRSELGEGSRFEVCLPRVKTDHARLNAVPQPHQNVAF